MMSNQMNERETQLERWGREIHEQAELAQRTRGRMRFTDLLRIDELKVLHAIAQTRFDELCAAGGSHERDRLEVEVQDAWLELAAAFDRPADQPPDPQPEDQTGIEP